MKIFFDFIYDSHIQIRNFNAKINEIKMKKEIHKKKFYNIIFQKKP